MAALAMGSVFISDSRKELFAGLGVPFFSCQRRERRNRLRLQAFGVTDITCEEITLP